MFEELGYDYQYNDAATNHNFFEKGTRKRLVFPNRIIVKSHPSHSATYQFSGSATDADSYAAIGRYIDSAPHYIRAVSDDQCTAIATAELQHLQVESERGSGRVPMNCGQEVMDYVKFTDSAASDTRTGNVGYLARRYIAGKRFDTELRFGAVAAEMPFITDAAGLDQPYVTWGYIQGLEEYINRKDIDLLDIIYGGTDGSLIRPYSIPAFSFSKAMQPFEIDLEIEAKDNNEIFWHGSAGVGNDGTITFADGTTQTITERVEASALTLTGTHFLYYDLQDANPGTLKSTTTPGTAIGPYKGLIAIVKMASVATNKAFILTPFGSDILVNRDQVVDNLVSTLQLADDAVTNAKIAVDAIQGDIIAAGAITETKIGDDSISTAKLKAASVTAAVIAAGTITTTEIAALTIAAGNIAADAVTADKILAGSVTTVKLDALAVSAEKIAANAVSAEKIAAGAVTVNKLLASDIDSILENGGFETSALTPWDAAQGSWAVHADYANGSTYGAQGGVQVADSHLYGTTKYDVRPNDVLTFSLDVIGADTGLYGGVAANANATMYIHWYNKDQGYLSNTSKTFTPVEAASWLHHDLAGKAPATTAFCMVEFLILLNASPTGGWRIDNCRLALASHIIVQGTPGGTRTEITAAHVAGYDGGDVLQWEGSSTTGKLLAGAGAVILDVEGIHRDTIAVTLDETGTFTDLTTGSTGAVSINLDKACLYAVTLEASNETDADDTYDIYVQGTNSNNALVAKSRHANCGDPRAEFICFYTGPTAGETTPTLYAYIKNNTGGTKTFQFSIRYTKLL